MNWKRIENERNWTENERKRIENERKWIENERKLIENEWKLIENERKLIENETKLIENERKLIENEKNVIENERILIENERILIEKWGARSRVLSTKIKMYWIFASKKKRTTRHGQESLKKGPKNKKSNTRQGQESLIFSKMKKHQKMFLPKETATTTILGIRRVVVFSRRNWGYVPETL